MLLSGRLILFVAVGTALLAQGNIVSTGDGDRPLLGVPNEIPLNGGRANFEIDTTKTRAFQFSGLAATTKIVCDKKTLKNNLWYRIEHTADCAVEASNSAKVHLRVMNEPAAAVAKFEPVNKGGWEIKVPREPRATSADLIFQLPKPPGGGGVDRSNALSQAPATPTQYDYHQSSFPLWGTMAVALAALIMSVLAFVRGPKSVRSNSSGDPDVAEPAGAAGADAVVNERLYAFSADLTRLSNDISAIGAQQQDIVSTLAQLASQQDLTAFREIIHRKLAEAQDAINSLGSAQARSFNRLREELDAINRDLTIQKKTIAQLSAGASENLTALLRIVPQEHFSANAGQETAQLLDQAVADFFCQSVPSRDGLKQSNERARAFTRTVESLLNDIGTDFAESGERLKPLLDQTRQIQAEIDGLLTAATNRLRLRFDVEFYASKANRDRLIDGITAGLKNQIVKLEKPIEYFDRQLLALTASGAQTATDFVDANVDPQRKNVRVQQLLQQVLDAGGLEQISPAPNEEFRASEHAVVQVMPRPGGPGRAPCVARLVARGFRRGQETIRKASVILYE